MKRFVVLFMVLGLMAGSVATAEAKKKKKKVRPVERRVERTVTGNYESPFVSNVTGCNPAGRQWGCLSIAAEGKESFLTAKVSDAHGLPVQVDVYAERQGRNNDLLGSFCGETTSPIAFPRGTKLHVWVGLAWINDYVHPDCPAYPSTGTISVTLSNLP